MPTRRQVQFQSAVAEAASLSKPVKARGRAVPENLTQDGRCKGISAMHNAPRCNRKNRKGQPCAAPAMRGSKRCLKHGGRVEVPEHPHNIKRFFQGRSEAVVTAGMDGVSDEEFWDRLSYPDKREILEILPPKVIANSSKLYLAARVWMDVRDRDYPAVKRFLKTFVRV